MNWSAIGPDLCYDCLAAFFINFYVPLGMWIPSMDRHLSVVISYALVSPETSLSQSFVRAPRNYKKEDSINQ